MSFLALFEAVAAWVGFQQGPWGDEIHFYQTVQQFGQCMGLNTLKCYNEMSSPLPFVVYAMWGNVFGFELGVLRFLSVVIALLTYATVFVLTITITRHSRLSCAIYFFCGLPPLYGWLQPICIHRYVAYLSIIFMSLGGDSMQPLSSGHGCRHGYSFQAVFCVFACSAHLVLFDPGPIR